MPYLLDGDGWLPVILGVEDAQTYRPGGVDVWVENNRGELDDRRLTRVIIGECNRQLVEPALPVRLGKGWVGAVLWGACVWCARH